MQLLQQIGAHLRCSCKEHPIQRQLSLGRSLICFDIVPVLRPLHLRVCVHFVDIPRLRRGGCFKLRRSHIPQGDRSGLQPCHCALALVQGAGKDRLSGYGLAVPLRIDADHTVGFSCFRAIYRLDLQNQRRVPLVTQFFQAVTQGGGGWQIGPLFGILQDIPETVKVALADILEKNLFKGIPLVRRMGRGNQPCRVQAVQMGEKVRDILLRCVRSLRRGRLRRGEVNAALLADLG